MASETRKLTVTDPNGVEHSRSTAADYHYVAFSYNSTTDTYKAQSWSATGDGARRNAAKKHSNIVAVRKVND